ncbi:MAG TPA: N-acetylmuramoyl-L-alanine amidase-like domain-containing protein [Longimicrobium sp.]
MSSSRRSFLRNLALSAAALAMPKSLDASSVLAAIAPADRERLAAWLRTLQRDGLASPRAPLGRAVARVGELALGTPYKAFTLNEYLAGGGPVPAHEPVTAYLTVFDCVTLVESTLAVARASATPGAGWDDFVREIERMRYRGGARSGYASRLHYWSEWISDNAARGLVRDLGPELGAVEDRRPLRFMTTHRASYPALRDDAVFADIAAMERRLDAQPRHLVAKEHIPAVMDRIQTGDVLGFACSIEGLDCTHTGLAYRDRAGVLRVLHAPLSGGEVQISRGTLPEYVAGLRSGTGILVARPLRG